MGSAAERWLADEAVAPADVASTTTDEGVAPANGSVDGLERHRTGPGQRKKKTV